MKLLSRRVMSDALERRSIFKFEKKTVLVTNRRISYYLDEVYYKRLGLASCQDDQITRIVLASTARFIILPTHLFTLN